MFRTPTAPRSARLIVSASIAAAALLLTGCSGGDSGTKETPEGPLTKYLSALYGDEEYTQERADKENLELEELVAKCMTQEGFEYVPNTQNTGVVYSSGDEDSGPQWGSEDFVKEYGYGIVSWPGQEEMNNQDPTQSMDPNEPYVSSLSESEQTAFYEALYGPGPSDEELAAMDDEEDGGSYEYNWETAGCNGSAQHEIQIDSGSADAAYEDPEFAELFESMQEVWSATYDDEVLNDGVTKLNRAWADCMAEADYSEFPSPTTVQEVLYDEYNALQMPDSDDGEYVEPSKDDLKKFKEREITIALVDFKCKQSNSYDAELLKIQNELEQEFVDEHKAELDALLAKYKPQASKG